MTDNIVNLLIQKRALPRLEDELHNVANKGIDSTRVEELANRDLSYFDPTSATIVIDNGIKRQYRICTVTVACPRAT